MSILDDNDIEELDSSAVSKTLDDSFAGDTGEADGANSSDAQPGENAEKDALSIVRDVVAERDGSDTAAASPAEGGTGGQATGDQPNSQEPDNESYSDVPFNKHPRFQQLIRERNTFRDDAVRYQNVQTFLDSHGVQAEEAADALLIAGLAKTDPSKCWDLVKPWVQNLLLAAGEVLPDDLEQRVQNGQISQEDALAMSRLRATNQSIERRQSFAEQRAESQRQSELVTNLVNTAEDWVKDRQTRDPNFAQKEPALMREIAYLQRTEGKPDTADGVKDQLKRAYDSVNASFRPAAPRPAPQRRPASRPVTGGQVNGNTRQQPRNTIDIIRMELDRSRGGV